MRPDRDLSLFVPPQASPAREMPTQPSGPRAGRPRPRAGPIRPGRRAGQAVARARAGEGPVLIECKTHRWFGHYAGDPQKYRPADNLEQSRNVDCIAHFEKFLLESDLADQGQLEAVNARLRSEIDDAIAHAEASPVAKGQFLNDVYA